MIVFPRIVPRNLTELSKEQEDTSTLYNREKELQLEVRDHALHVM